MMMARLSLLNSLPRLASMAPFLCLMVAQCEWPDMAPLLRFQIADFRLQIAQSEICNLKSAILMVLLLPGASVFAVVPCSGDSLYPVECVRRSGRRATRLPAPAPAGAVAGKPRRD